MAFLKSSKFDFHLPRKFGGGGGNAALDAAEEQRHQELERLFTATRAGKHFQKDFVKGAEGIVTTGHKQFEVSSKLGEDCKKYSAEGPGIPETLKRAAQQYGSARSLIEKERENFHRSLTRDVSEPLKAMANGSPLEDARHLKQKYDRLRQDADSQACDVNKRKSRDPGSNPDHVVKLQAAEQKLDEITSALETMGLNATSAMTEVESQQHITTLQKMLAMVEAERAYFLRVTTILDSLHYEIESEVQKSSTSVQRSPTSVQKSPTSVQKSSSSVPRNSSRGSSASPPSLSSPTRSPQAHSTASRRQTSVDQPGPFHRSSDGSLDYEDYEVSVGRRQESNGDKAVSPAESKSFYATATHNFEGQDDGELTISIGDEVLVLQATASGWSEGLINGESGWFPSEFVVRKPPVRRARTRPGSLHGSR